MDPATATVVAAATLKYCGVGGATAVAQAAADAATNGAYLLTPMADGPFTESAFAPINNALAHNVGMAMTTSPTIEAPMASYDTTDVGVGESLSSSIPTAPGVDVHVPVTVARDIDDKFMKEILDFPALFHKTFYGNWPPTPHPIPGWPPLSSPPEGAVHTLHPMSEVGSLNETDVTLPSSPDGTDLAPNLTTGPSNSVNGSEAVPPPTSNDVADLATHPIGIDNSVSGSAEAAPATSGDVDLQPHPISRVGIVNETKEAPLAASEGTDLMAYPNGAVHVLHPMSGVESANETEGALPSSPDSTELAPQVAGHSASVNGSEAGPPLTSNDVGVIAHPTSGIENVQETEVALPFTPDGAEFANRPTGVGNTVSGIEVAPPSTTSGDVGVTPQMAGPSTSVNGSEAVPPLTSNDVGVIAHPASGIQDVHETEVALPVAPDGATLANHPTGVGNSVSGIEVAPPSTSGDVGVTPHTPSVSDSSHGLDLAAHPTVVGNCVSGGEVAAPATSGEVSPLAASEDTDLNVHPIGSSNTPYESETALSSTQIHVDVTTDPANPLRAKIDFVIQTPRLFNQDASAIRSWITASDEVAAPATFSVPINDVMLKQSAVVSSTENLGGADLHSLRMTSDFTDDTPFANSFFHDVGQLVGTSPYGLFPYSSPGGPPEHDISSLTMLVGSGTDVENNVEISATEHGDFIGPAQAYYDSNARLPTHIVPVEAAHAIQERDLTSTDSHASAVAAFTAAVVGMIGAGATAVHTFYELSLRDLERQPNCFWRRSLPTSTMLCPALEEAREDDDDRGGPHGVEVAADGW